MMGLLSFFNPSAWLQTVGAGVICFGLGFGGGVVKGYNLAGVEALHGKIAAISAVNLSLVAAAEQKDAQIEADRKIAEANDAEAAAMAAHVEKVIHETSGSPAACKLSASQLRDLKQFAKR